MINKLKQQVNRGAYLFIALLFIFSIPCFGSSNRWVGAVVPNTNPTDGGQGKWPEPRFITAKDKDGKTCDAAVYDKLTGLMWLRDGSQGMGDGLDDAKQYIEGLNNSSSSPCGYKDWRLPTANEFHNLANYAIDTTPGDWLDSHGFIKICSEPTYCQYWTSTPFNGPSPNKHYQYQWIFALNSGVLYAENTISKNVSTLAVRTVVVE